jgi:hypothetical protein
VNRSLYVLPSYVVRICFCHVLCCLCESETTIRNGDNELWCNKIHGTHLTCCYYKRRSNQQQSQLYYCCSVRNFTCTKDNNNFSPMTACSQSCLYHQGESPRRLWRFNKYVLPKSRLNFIRLYDVTSQTLEFMITVTRTWNPTCFHVRVFRSVTIDGV